MKSFDEMYRDGELTPIEIAPLKHKQKLFQVRIFRDDEVTELVYHNVTHAFWTNRGTVLTLCLPDRHANWLREQICHYDIQEEN